MIAYWQLTYGGLWNYSGAPRNFYRSNLAVIAYMWNPGDAMRYYPA